MKAMEQHQRVCVAIERAEAATHHSWANSGQILPEFGRIHHLKRDFTDLAVYPAQQFGACLDIGVAEAQPEAAWLLQAGVHVRQFQKFLLARPAIA